MTLYLDFDELCPEKRIVKIGGKEFDVTDMPAETMMLLNRRTIERKREGLEVLYEDFVEILCEWLKPQDSTITEAWITEHLPGSKIKSMIIAIFNPITNSPLGKFEEKKLTSTKSNVSEPQKS